MTEADARKAATELAEQKCDMCHGRENLALEHCCGRIKDAYLTGFEAGRKSRDAEVEEREAAVCPEDVGFEEYIRSMQSQLTTLTEELEAHRATSLGSKINELIVERGELREQSRALREAAEQASARLLEGSPIKGGQVFVPGSAADSLLKAADDARLMLREALKGGG